MDGLQNFPSLIIKTCHRCHRRLLSSSASHADSFRPPLYQSVALALVPAVAYFVDLTRVHALCHVKSGLMPPPCIIQQLSPRTPLDGAGVDGTWRGEALSGRMGSHTAIRGAVSEPSGPRTADLLSRYVVAAPVASLWLNRFGHFECKKAFRQDLCFCREYPHYFHLVSLFGRWAGMCLLQLS